MIRFRDISIRNKLVLMQVFTSILVLSIVFTVFIATNISYYRTRKVNSMRSLAQVIGVNSISTIRFQDSDAAKDILSDLHTVSSDIIGAGIVDSAGNLFSSFTVDGPFEVPQREFKNDILVFKDHMWVRSPIIDQQSNLGSVIVQSNMAEVLDIKKVQYQLAALLLVMALGVSFIIAIVTQLYISRRLLKLVGAMERGKRENTFATIQDEGKDEISILTNVYNDLMQQVKENQQRKDEFIGIASHELKTPLTSVKGYIELLNMMEDAPQKKQLVGKALQNVAKLETLIRDLLDVSKIQSGQLELHITEFDMNQLLSETIAAMQMIYDSHTIKWEEQPGVMMVKGDRQRIEQVLINLLSNAIKYSPGEEEVIVTTSQPKGELMICIKDFGIGVPQQESENIFERFYRTRDISVHISGFGLGLYICRDIINRHKGRIGVTANEKGSTFFFTLPLATNAPREDNKILEIEKTNL